MSHRKVKTIEEEQEEKLEQLSEIFPAANQDFITKVLVEAEWNMS